MNLRHILGRRGEKAAAAFLKRKGFRIVAANHRTPAGEVDLIAREGDTVVFVEVKTRSDDEKEAPYDAVGNRQRQRLLSAARYFLAGLDGPVPPCRFDVIRIVWPARGKPRIEHFENAFPLDSPTFR